MVDVSRDRESHDGEEGEGGGRGEEIVFILPTVVRFDLHIASRYYA